MKKRFGLKAGMIGLALLSAGAAVAVPLAVPQTAVTAEAATEYPIKRYITFYWKYDNGTTELASQGAYYQKTASSPSKKMTFEARDAHDFISGIPDGWKIENPDIPSANISYNDQPAEEKIYIVQDKEAMANAVKVTRTINIYKKYSDGRTEKVGSLPYESEPLLNKDQVVNFDAITTTTLLKDYDTGAWSPWKPENNTVPAASGSYNNPPADYNVYLVIDANSGITQKKTVTRTIKYYKKDENGNKSHFKTSSDGIIFLEGTSNTAERTFKDINVEEITGYTANKTVVKGRKVTPASNDFTEEVIYTKNPDVVKEEKTVWRKINFIDKDTGKKIKGSQSQGTIFTREVIKDANGNVTHVVTDWQSSGTIKAYTVPDIEGYSHKVKTVPAVTVKPSDSDIEVNVEYVSTRYTVNYHLDDSSPASNKKTVVNYGGDAVKTLTISQLSFSKPGYTFTGWKAYREIDGKWYVKDSSGKKVFMKLEDGILPEGYTFVIYKDGAGTRTFAKNGNVHFYGTWSENAYTVKYHLDDNSPESSQTTRVIYGKQTNTLTLDKLGFSKPGYKFVGWKSYRESDGKWFVKNSDGKKEYMKLNNGQLPSGYSFVIYKNGATTKAISKTGNVHFYGVWKK